MNSETEVTLATFGTGFYTKLADYGIMELKIKPKPGLIPRIRDYVLSRDY
jgi:hypothetical protein